MIESKKEPKERTRLALTKAGIGSAYAKRRLSEFGERGIEWGKRVTGKDGHVLGLSKGLFIYAASRDFVLTLAGAIAAHDKASVRHLPLAYLADVVDAPFDYAEEMESVQSCGVLCITDFFSLELAKGEAFPLRTRLRVQSSILSRVDACRSVLLQGDVLEANPHWWQPSFIQRIESKFQTIPA